MARARADAATRMDTATRMIAWFILLGVVVAVLVALARFGRLPRSALEMSFAALVIGAIGYAWQGSPALRGQPIEANEGVLSADTAAMEARPIYVSAFDQDVAWFNFSEALIRSGSTREAVIAARSGIAKNPRSAAMWVNLGNALVAHAEGTLTPPAKLAFNRAHALAPADPAPHFFYGLALAESGRFKEAASVWRALLARAPKDAPWRADLSGKVAGLDMLIARASGEGRVPPAGR